MRYARRYAALLFCLAVLCVVPACGPTKQARSMETSGFLGNLYPMMHKGQNDEALLVYINPKVQSIPKGTYKKLLLGPVQVWGEPTMDMVRQGEVQKVADMFYTLLYQNLSEDYQMVSDPAPGTLHIQTAITRADKAYVVLRAISTVPAPMNAFAAASMLKNIATGKPLFVGDVSVETKLLDASTGEVLAAFADRRVGNKRLDVDSFDSWDDVHKALAYWAEKARYRLCKQRGDTSCVPPKG
ncbi:MAG TPA: DUF3313 domain-containing protein [Nitrospira sp.]|nr:DUF3313 domain-containing protein [Nitrospira sp.]